VAAPKILPRDFLYCSRSVNIKEVCFVAVFRLMLFETDARRKTSYGPIFIYLFFDKAKEDFGAARVFF
jgi:hypothetical protein